MEKAQEIFPHAGASSSLRANVFWANIVLMRPLVDSPLAKSSQDGTLICCTGVAAYINCA